MAEPLARVWDESERAKNAFTVLVPGRNQFHVGNKPRSTDINVFHDTLMSVLRGLFCLLYTSDAADE